MREVPAVPHCCGCPGHGRRLGRQRCQQPPTGTAGQRPRARAGRGVRAPPDWPQRGAPRKVPRAAAGAARRGPAEWAAESASSRWVRAAPGAGGGRGEASPGQVPQHPAAGGRGCPGSRRAPLSSPSICNEAPGSRSHPLRESDRRRSRAEGLGGDTLLPGAFLGARGKRGCCPPRPLLPRIRSPCRS